jgi:branched-chain amino acid transport system substrate-binding protein
MTIGKEIAMKKLLVAALAAAGIAAASPASAGDITVCIWGSLTGPDTSVNGVVYGPRDYFEHLNQTKGGIAGNKVKVLLLDGRYKLDEELKLYRRCVDQEQAVFVSGWSTGAAKALRSQIAQDKVPFLTQSCASEVLDPEKLPYMFLAGPTYEQQMIIAIRELAKSGKKNLIIMIPDNEYGRGPTNVVRQSGIIQKLGVNLVDVIEFPFDAQDITAQMIRAKAKNPDMIYVQGSAPQALAVLRDAAKVGLPAQKFVGNMFALSPTIPEQLGASVEGFRAIQAYSDYGSDIPAMAEIKAFKAKNEVAKQDVYYMRGWLEGAVMAKAIENAIAKNGGKVPSDIGVFRQGVRDQMEQLKDVDVGGIVPPVNYANHQGSTQARMAEIRSGQYVALGEWIDAQ